jgi:hypothetical protein
MLSFKEYSQLNESPDVAGHIINHIIKHPKLKDFSDKVKVHKRAAKYWWERSWYYRWIYWICRC